MSRDDNRHLRLTAEENELLTHLSNLTRCSKSQVLRNLLHGATLIEAPPVAYNELLVELRRVGVNLNQIARAEALFCLILPYFCPKCRKKRLLPW